MFLVLRLTLSFQGFLTPTELFYVRNHGAVPKVDEELAQNWTLRVHGLVKNECALTLDDLKRKFPVVTLPVTLVCAGNRRKEQNMVLKGLGFSWGAAGGNANSPSPIVDGADVAT
jgi:nitrate reductase (NAD(P)H)